MVDGCYYQLYIYLLVFFVKEFSWCYLVFYVIDGYWDFLIVVVFYDNMVYDKVLLEFIVVGFGYVGDNLDYGQLCIWELLFVCFGLQDGDFGYVDKFLVMLEC